MTNGPKKVTGSDCWNQPGTCKFRGLRPTRHVQCTLPLTCGNTVAGNRKQARYPNGAVKKKSSIRKKSAPRLLDNPFSLGTMCSVA